MKYLDWDEEKNRKLKLEREVCFEDVITAIEEDKILDIVEHPNQKRYPSQHKLIVNILDYAYIVPFIEDEEKIFLKTIIPSRKATKKYLKNN